MMKYGMTFLMISKIKMRGKGQASVKDTRKIANNELFHFMRTGGHRFA